MLLCEILDKLTHHIKTSNRQVDDLISRKKHQVVGAGAQSLAYLHSKFPGKVIKTIQIRGYSDPSYQFLRLVLKHQDNPYFPKIFSVKKYPTSQTSQRQRGIDFREVSPGVEFEPAPSQADYTLYVVMEWLQPLSTMSENDLIKFQLQNYLPTNMYNFAKKSSKDMPGLKFCNAFKDPDVRKYMIAHITDPTLKQSLRLLEPLLRQFEPDMHGSNILMRGAQWVFIDPVTHTFDGSE